MKSGKIQYIVLSYAFLCDMEHIGDTRSTIYKYNINRILNRNAKQNVNSILSNSNIVVKNMMLTNLFCTFE